MVADVAGDHGEAVHRGRALAGDRGLGGIAVLGDLVGRVRGRRRRDRGRPRHRGEEPPALVERGRVRADDLDLLERHRGRANEAVADRQDRLAGDRERRVVEQVVRLVHRPGERALDGQDAERDVAVGGRLDDRGEARERDQVGPGREQPVTGGGAVRAVAPGIGNARRHRRNATEGSAGRRKKTSSRAISTSSRSW